MKSWLESGFLKASMPVRHCEPGEKVVTSRDSVGSANEAMDVKLVASYGSSSNSGDTVEGFWDSTES